MLITSLSSKLRKPSTKLSTTKKPKIGRIVKQHRLQSFFQLAFVCNTPKMVLRRSILTLSRRAVFTPIPRRTFTTSFIRRDAPNPDKDIKKDPKEGHSRLDPIPGQTEDMIPFDRMHRLLLRFDQCQGVSGPPMANTMAINRCRNGKGSPTSRCRSGNHSYRS